MIRALILITAVILASCDGGFNDGKDKRTKPESGKIVARIGSSHITEQQLRDAVESLPVKQRILIESSREQKDRFVESYINKEILYREALKRGYGEKEDIKKSVEDYKKKIVIRKLSEDLLKLEITDSQLEQYYEENKEKYKAALITQVSVTPRDKDNVDTDKLQGFLKTIKTRLQKDESLDDPSNNTLYNVKIKKAAEVRRDKYYKALADTIFNMSVGEISEPVKLKNSYIILKILEGPYYLPFKKVKNNIKFEVRNNNFNSYLKNLKDSENVEIYISEEIKETKSNAEN